MLAKLTIKSLNALESLKDFGRNDEGAVTVEYGLLVGLLVLTIAGFLITFGNAIGAWLGTISAGLGAWGPVAP